MTTDPIMNVFVTICVLQTKLEFDRCQYFSVTLLNIVSRSRPTALKFCLTFPFICALVKRFSPRQRQDDFFNHTFLTLCKFEANFRQASGLHTYCWRRSNPTQVHLLLLLCFLFLCSPILSNTNNLLK